MYRVAVILAFDSGWCIGRYEGAQRTLPCESHIAGLQNVRRLDKDFVHCLSVQFNVRVMTDRQRVSDALRVGALCAGRSDQHQKSDAHNCEEIMHFRSPKSAISQAVGSKRGVYGLNLRGILELLPTLLDRYVGNGLEP